MCDGRCSTDLIPFGVKVSDPRKLAAGLIDWEPVAGVQVVSADTLIVETLQPDRVYDRLPELILAAGLNAREIAAADASLEAVFGYLTAGGR